MQLELSGPKLKLALEKTGVTLEKILVTHGHMDHCGQAGVLARELGVPIEGPHEGDRFWIESLDDPTKRYGLAGESFDGTGTPAFFAAASASLISFANRAR